MFGHKCPETIALVCPHPCHRQIAICSVKHNLTIFDVAKNRSIRTFSINDQNVAASVARQTPIGLFFVDNVSCRAIEAVLRIESGELPASDYLCLVFPKGVVIWDHTVTVCKFYGFAFTATCAAQTPNGLVIGDNGNSLHMFDLRTHQIRQIGQVSEGSPAALFITQNLGECGIVAVSSTGMIELFAANGRLSCQCMGDVSKVMTFDPFTGMLFVLKEKRVRGYRVTTAGISKEAECGFSSVVIGDAKPVSYSVQNICPCHLPITTHPMFFAICDQNALLIGGKNRVMQRVETFPAEETKKMSVSMMIAHPTDMSLVIMCSGQDMVVLDVFAHLPQIVPSVAIPNFVKDTEAAEGIFNVKMNEELIVIINRSAETYTVYDRQTKQRIVTRSAFDVVLGPRRMYAHLSAKRKENAKELTLELFVGDKSLRSTSLTGSRGTKDIPMRLLSVGELCAVVAGDRTLGLSFNIQKQGMTKSHVYKWGTLEPISVQCDNAAMLEFQPPYLAIASPNEYAVYKVGRAKKSLQEIVRRQKRIFHFMLQDDRLYTLTYDGLEVDNLTDVVLLASRFSHLRALSESQLVPMNAMTIAEVQESVITVVDTNGNSTPIKIPDELDPLESLSPLMRIARAENCVDAARIEYEQTESAKERKRMKLMLLERHAIDPDLTVSERAAKELADECQEHTRRDQFTEFVRTQLEIEP